MKILNLKMRSLTILSFEPASTPVPRQLFYGFNFADTISGLEITAEYNKHFTASWFSTLFA